MHLEEALMLVRAEVERAVRKHQPMHSIHEGWAVIFEEFHHELGAEVFRQIPNKSALTTEAIHTAAMAIRFLIDLCPGAPCPTDEQQCDAACRATHHLDPRYPAWRAKHQ